MIKARNSKEEVQIIKASIGDEGPDFMDIETVSGNRTCEFVRPKDLTADGGFWELEKAIFRSMK